MTSSWTQVYITGLSRSITPTDAEIETMLDDRYQLSSLASSSPSCGWAGSGTTVIKRDGEGKCRGFAFVSFHSYESASIFIDQMNNNNKNSIKDIILHAEMSTPGKKVNMRDGGAKNKKKMEDGNYLPDLRLRRQRKQPVRKHPVIVSSNGKRTNLSKSNKAA